MNHTVESPSAFAALDANWDCALELYAALSRHMSGVAFDLRDICQARRTRRGAGFASSLGCVAPGLQRVRWALPPGWFHSLNAVTMPVVGRWARRRARSVLGTEVSVWIISSPYYLRAVRAIRPRFTVYHVLDDYRWYWPSLASRTERLETRLIETVDLVVCVSEYLAGRIREQVPRKADDIVCISNGAPESFFSQPTSDALARVAALMAGLERPFFLYLGNPQGRADFSMLSGLAEVRRGTVLIRGPEGVLGELAGRRSVRVLPLVAPGDMPALLSSVDVLLIPQADSEFNRAASPRKLWEYLASGKPIVGSCLPLAESEPLGIRLARTPEEFVRHALDLASGGDREDERQIRRKVAESHRYPVLAERLLAEVAMRFRDKATQLEGK